MEQQLITRQLPPEQMLQFDRSSFRQQGTRGAGGNSTIRFGRFCVLPYARQLLFDGRPVALGSRAFDILMVLIEAPGTLVTKNEIVGRVWPDTIVEEGNLKVQVSALRKTLSRDRNYIKTVQGRGYLFISEVSVAPVSGDALASPGPKPEPLEPAPTNPATFPLPPRPQVMLSSDEDASTVVVIDDDADIREALEGLLRSVGLRARLFASVQEFLDSRPELPGCLVLDIRLPGRSGLDFQEELAKANLRLPVIFISGHADVPMSVRAMKAGAVEFLTKPFRDQDLLDAIQLAIAQDRARRNNENVVSRAAVGPSHADAARA